jgi:hypothetical protein
MNFQKQTILYFSDEFTIADLKNEWKSIENRYLMMDPKKTVETRKAEDIPNNEFIKLMSFLSGSRLSRRGMKFLGCM